LYQSLLQDSKYFDLLLKLDEELAAEYRRAGCDCGGVLHSARYDRKPRGGPAGVGPTSGVRFSFCCATEGCRRRATPSSLRFLGRKVLELYSHVPGTTGYFRRSDRRFAGELHDRGIPLDIVDAAILLAVARRTIRSHDAPPLQKIATLHYFRPIIEELIAEPPPPGYIGYIRFKLAAVAPELVAAANHRLS